MRSFRRGWAAACAAAYFVTNVAAAHAVEKSLWEERRVALRRTTWGARGAPVALLPLAGSLPVFDGGSTPSQPPSNFFKAAVPFDAASAALPYGTVSEMREGRPGAPVVFLVQDVHGNDGAQKNIGGLLTDWAARGVTLVGVEGAWVPIDLATFHQHPSSRSVSLVADALRKAGWLSGAEWAGMTAAHSISLVGIESRALYRDNVKAARECVARRPVVAAFLTRLQHFLQAQKDHYYSPELKNFDHSIREYRNGQRGLADHVRFLSEVPGAESQAGVQVKRFLKALELESQISFSQADADRRVLMDRLARCLDPRALDSLLNHAVAYRAGKTTNGDFFSFLKNLCAAHRIPLKAYPAFSDYLDYVGIVQSIRRGDLIRELDRWETDLATDLAKSSAERRLLVLDADAVLIRKLLENEMSPESWALFLQRRADVMSLPVRLQEWGNFYEAPEGLVHLSQPHEEFCRLAIERNKVLASQFVATVMARKADQAVLVAGGFHTPGLQEELAQRGCSTVVITPRIEKIEGKPLDVFARDPLPFDRLFAGKPISLSPKLLMGQEGGPAFVMDLVRAHRQASESGPLSPQKSGLVKIIHPSGALILAGPSDLVSKQNVRSLKKVETLDGLDGKSIALFVPVSRVSAGELAMKWLQFFFPLLRLTPLHVVPMELSNPVRVWTEYWGLGKRSMAGRDGYNGSIDDFFKDFFERVNPKSKLLDVGGGAGYLGNLALNTSREFDVVELDPAKVPEKSRFFGLRYVRATAENMPFASGTFDGLMDSYALAYSDMEKSIDEMFRVLKPGGKAAILLHSSKSDLVQNSQMEHDTLRQMGWNESVLDKIEEYLKVDTPAVRKKELHMDFIELYMSIVGGAGFEDNRVKNSASGPLDILVNLLFHGGDRALSLVQIYRVSFSVWDQLFRAADKAPTERTDVEHLFSRAGFVVNRVGVSQHEGFVQGWEVELTKPRFNFQIARSGLSIRVAISNSSGAEVASAMVGGKRGAIEIQNISIEPGESTCAYDLIAGAVKEFLLLKGQGRVLLRGVKDPRVKRVAQEMFGNKLIMARKGFGRSLNGPWKDAIDPSSEEFHRLLEDPTALVDLAGTLTPEARQALWPNEDLPSLELGATVSLAQKVVFTRSTDEALRRAYSDFSALESDLYEILVGDQKVGGIIFSETSKKLFLKTIKIDDSVQGNGIGKIVFRALAKRATLILSPELNLAGHPVPFEGRSVKNPAAFSIMKGIYKTGTMEAVPLGTKYQTDEDEPVSSWDNALKEGTPAFEQLTGPANIGENGEYKILFHLRGVIANEIEDEAARETLREQWVADKELYSRGATPLNSFALLGGGFPFDPLIGLTVAAIFLVTMFFKDEILKWLEGRAPPPVQDFVNKFVPSFKFPQETVQRMVEKLIASPLTIPLRFSIIPGESELSAGHSLFSSEKRLPPFDPRPVNNGLLAEPYARYAESVSISRKGIGFLIVLFDGRGQEIGKATTFGKRGEITVTDIEIRTNEKGAGLALLSQVAQFGLFPGGEGRILIRRTNNSEIMKAAVDLFDAESLLVAPHRFDRVVKNSYWNDQISPELDEAFFEKMERSSNSMDVSGVLSKEKRRTLWPGGRGFPGVVEMKAEGFRSVSLDSKDKMFDVRDENGTPVGRAICSLNSTSLVLKWIDSSSQGGGWGKASLLAVAMEASRILMPELNRNGRPVPLVVENIMDPRTAHILMKYIFKPGTMEALPSQNAFSLIGSGSPVNWNNGISEKDPRFQLLVRPPAGAEWRQYHLRGELQDPIYAWAESRFQSRQLTNSFYFLPLGTPFDPILGLTVAAIFLGAMLFKGEILNWLKGRVPPGVYVFANSAIPDLSSFRPRIVRVFTQVLGFLIEQIVEIVGRLFGMAELQVPVALGIIPQDGKTTEFISRGPSSRLDDIVKAMDSSDIQGIYEHLAHYFGLWGVAADVGSSSYDLPAKGLLAGGMKKVSLVDHLHHEQKSISPGIDVFPGDATNLSNRFGEKTLDAIVFHRSLHHIVADKEFRGSGAGQLLIEAGSSPDDIFFHIDLLSRVMDETFKTLKPGGRVLLYFDAHTFRLPGLPGFFGWSLEDMLAEKGFEDVSLITSKNGTVLATGVRPNRSLGYTFSGGIGVSRLSVNDTLDEADREVFSKALGAISPTVFDMQGVDVLIDPRRVALERNPVEELKNKMGVSSGAVGEMSPEKVEGIIQQDPASIHWVRGFSSKPNGVNSLAETCVESARKGDPNASGAALAAWDDSKLLAGPNPGIVAALLAVLIGDKKDQAVGLTDQFAEAYNRVRAGLLLPKLLSGTLMKPSTGSELQSGIILNISALFDQQAEDTAKNNTWLALAAALSVRERNPNVPLGLVVHGVDATEESVRETLSQSVPRWANFMTDGVSLFVQGNTVGKTVFVNDKFSLKALRTNPLWNRPLTVLGLSAEAIAESIDQDKSVDLIPLDVFVNKQLQQVLQQVRFILRNA